MSNPYHLEVLNCG